MSTLGKNTPIVSGLLAAWYGLNHLLFLLVKVTGAIALIGWWIIPPMRWFADGPHSTAAWWWLGGGYVVMMIMSTLAYLSALGAMMDQPEKNAEWVAMGWFGIFMMLFVYFAPASLVALLSIFNGMNPNPGQMEDSVPSHDNNFPEPYPMYGSFDHRAESLFVFGPPD